MCVVLLLAAGCASRASRIFDQQFVLGFGEVCKAGHIFERAALVGFFLSYKK